VLHDPMFWAKFDYVLAEHPEKVIGSWAVVHVVYGFGGVRVLGPGEESGSSSEPVYEQNGAAASTPDWTSKVAQIWRVLEGLLRNTLLRGYWVEIGMEPRIHILHNQLRKP